MFTQKLALHPYSVADREAVLHLLRRSARAHRHFDWQSPEECLDDPDVPGCVGVDADGLRAGIVLSAPLAGNVWLRALAVDYGLSVAPVCRRMWGCLASRVRAQGVTEVAVLQREHWLASIMAALGFERVDRVVNLQREASWVGCRPPAPNADVLIEPACADDLDAILAVDAGAFEPRWRLSEREACAGWRSAAVILVARLGEDIAGYAIGTTYGAGGHVARLATLPAAQGRGIGGGLLDKLLRWFEGQGRTLVTVNTQASNAVSIRLYARYGFVRTGDDLPVLALTLS